ncbi:polyprotein [Rhynchospora pubera]|uniref:Polyprotein n=1 Tax=Rhynchospora pubera TaxID=906938 RepID=A0AAV8GYP9_9POAL|nr:polyprotein [Rhynchospora pubera]
MAFLSGLRDELKYTVGMYAPSCLNHAYQLARQAELSLEGQEKRSKAVLKTWGPPDINPRIVKLPEGGDRKPLPLLPAPPLRLPQGHSDNSKPSFENMRKLGLCYWCGEKYYQGHKCQKKRLHMLEAIDSEGEVHFPDIELEDSTQVQVMEEPSFEQADISMCSPLGGSNSQTLKFKGFIHQTPILTLIDSGSTHSFIHPSVVHLNGVPTVPAPPMLVKTASGSKLLSDSKCQPLQFALQQHQFEGEFRVLEVQGYDVILGMDWIAKVGPVIIDCVQGVVKLKQGDTEVSLLLQSEVAEVKLCHGEVCLTKEQQKGSEIIFAQLFVTQMTASSDVYSTLEDHLPNMPPQLQQVVLKFHSVFSDPSSLPPARPTDHQIPLKADVTPVNIRPYRFSHFQKPEIEKIIEELLVSGYIRASTSPFASPILLVKKKDHSWRLCVDYRKLNDITVKNKFPIPIIDDILDELHGAKIFSKINLKYGYHQIRMFERDIPKTAFRTHLGHYEFTVMPFGLTNAPATFQALMNSIFKPFLRKFILVFFDDILIYSHNMEEHIHHLTIALQVLQDNQLYAKLSKCTIGTTSVEYLGHLITEEGVSTDPSKVEAMTTWPTPTNIKQLRGFLGLTGYYRKFVRNYGMISKPLTELLKNDAFKWGPEAQQAFQLLKQAMITTPVLALPDFTKPFILETDACQVGIGAVLMQDKKPLAFFSKGLGIKSQGLSTYEKELLAVVAAVTKWKHYLMGATFIIRTDHISLKHLLEQRVNTAMQHTSLSKLLGLHYVIEYKKGTHNLVADALSRREGHDDPGMHSTDLYFLSEITPQWVTELLSSYDNDEWIEGLKKKLLTGPVESHKFTQHQGLLRYKGRLCVGKSNQWRHKLLHEFHGSSLGGHSGSLVTYKRMKALFYWPSMKEFIVDHIRQCEVCQLTKPEHVPSPGLLQPLPIPSEAWNSIGMDFITGLPKSEGKEVLLVVVDRLTKYSHFLPFSHPYTAASVAQVFLDNVYKLHGLPVSIVSDRDPIFTSQFWQELMTKLGVKLNLSTSYHPQTDGQVERVNQCVEAYLRSMVFQQQKKWVKWVPLAEYWYNTNFHSSIQSTPFKALYGYDPHVLALGSAPRCSVESVNEMLRQRQQMLVSLRNQLVKAQERMKKFADSRRSERHFSKGDWVYLKLQPYRQLSVSGTNNNKLNPKFYGPYEVLEKVGQARVGSGQPVAPSLPLISSFAPPVKEPVAILARRLIKRRNNPIAQILVQLRDQPPEEASWEDYTSLTSRFPTSILEDKDPFKRGGMSGGEQSEVSMAVGALMASNRLTEEITEREIAVNKKVESREDQECKAEMNLQDLIKISTNGE